MTQRSSSCRHAWFGCDRRSRGLADFAVRGVCVFVSDLQAKDRSIFLLVDTCNTYWLYFQNMGAYTSAAASSFNGFDPSPKFYVCSVRPENLRRWSLDPTRRSRTYVGLQYMYNDLLNKHLSERRVIIPNEINACLHVRHRTCSRLDEGCCCYRYGNAKVIYPAKRLTITFIRHPFRRPLLLRLPRIPRWP